MDSSAITHEETQEEKVEDEQKDERKKVSASFKWPKPMSQVVISFLADLIRDGYKPDKGFKNTKLM